MSLRSKLGGVSNTDNTVDKQRGLVSWQPGQSGNPAGRPKGSRNKLAEAFVADVMSDWEQHGPSAIVAMREKNPADYVRVVASIIPKDVTVSVSELAELTDEQLASRLRLVVDQLVVLGHLDGPTLPAREAVH